MAIKIAINGFDNICRLLVRQLFNLENIEIVAINDFKNNIETLAYLLQYNSLYKTWKANKIKIDKTENTITIDDKTIKVYHEKNILNLPWDNNNIDIVLETTSCFATKVAAEMHQKAGAKKVIITNITNPDIKTIIYDVNHQLLKKEDTIISTASSTINALALVTNALDTKFGIGHSCITIIQPVMNHDDNEKNIDLHYERTGMLNIIPAINDAAEQMVNIIPNFTAKLISSAVCVPVLAGSLIDISLSFKTKTTVEMINSNMKLWSNESFGYTEDAVVSSDIINSSYGVIFDGTQTRVVPVEKTGLLVKLFAWYDHYMSYVNQVIRTLLYMIELANN